MAVLAVLFIVISFLCLSTATYSAGSEIDPSSILLTDQVIATNMAVTQLAILRILSDLSAPGQDVLQQCRKETASETLEARINQYETQLNQTGQQVKLQWNETQAVSKELEALIHQTRQDVLQQCRKETQSASETLEARINEYETQLNQTGQAVVQQWNETQAASEALEARINQTEIQFRQQVEQQWNETQAITEALEALIHQTNNTKNDIGTSSCSGNKVLHGSSGLLELSSAMYTDNKDCGWEIVAPEGSVLDIHWDGFQLEKNTDCVHDWVKVVDSYRPNELIYGQKLCGTPDFLYTNSYITSTNKLKVTFHSDGSGTANGFKMWFQALQIPSGYHNTLSNVGTPSCSGTTELHGTTGTLQLTTAQYDYNKDCTWKVMAPEGSVLALQWFKFHTEIHYDWVKIVDLYRPTELVYGTALSGNLGFFNTSSWMVSSNLIKVSFHSDNSDYEDGFKLRFQALQIPYSSLQQTRQVIHNDTVPSTCSGHKVVEGTWGRLALTSYTHNKDCSWLVKTPPGSVVSLRWLHFNLEQHSSCSNDWVKVTDLKRPAPLVYGKKLCGTPSFLNNRALTVASDRIHIAFHSDGSNVGTGFRLEYQALQVPTTNMG